MKNHSEKCALARHPHFEKGQESGMQCKCLKPPCDCDGYHTFGELYEHRHALWIVLCFSIDTLVKAVPDKNPLGAVENGFLSVWRSRRHSDGELAFNGDWFLLGINKEKGKQMTYHLPMSKWDECEFAETLEKAPEWDGHTSDDVLERIGKL